MIRIKKSKAKVKEIPSQWKEIKKEPVESNPFDEEEETDNLEEQVESFTPRTSRGSSAPVLESTNAVQGVNSIEPRKRKEDSTENSNFKYTSGNIYNMPSYSGSNDTQQRKPDVVTRTSPILEANQRSQVRPEEWHEVRQARQMGGQQTRESVLTVRQLETDNKLPFEQNKYKGRKII